MHEVDEACRQIQLLLDTLQPLAAAEADAGKPATPGSHQDRFNAAWVHFMQLLHESSAIQNRLGGCRMCSQRSFCHGPAFGDSALAE